MKCPKCETVNPAGSKFCRGCATPLPSGPLEQASFTRTLETSTGELTRGMLFAGRYEIIEELGAGGMGRVYRVFDKKIEEEVALKLIRPEIAAERRTVERFRNEIKIARKIRHAHVCGMHDLHEEGKTLFLTMEYVRGEDLKSFLKQSRTLSVGTAVSIARQVAEGLGEAHRLGVVHRDLKPGNVMIDKDGNAKIMDFGIARSLAGGAGTAEGAIIGTPEYMSPEQVEGKPAGPQSDIYALGVILFEMVTGRLPFEGDTALAIAHQHKYEPTPDPRTLNPQVPLALGRLILRSMEKEAEERYQRIEELIADFAAVETSLPATELAPALRPSAGRKLATSKTITVKITPRKLVIPAVTIIAFAAIAIFVLTTRRTETAIELGRPNVALLNFQNLSEAQDLKAWERGLAELLFVKLYPSRFIDVIDTSVINGVLRKLNLQDTETYTNEDLDRIAREARATHILSGSFLKAGEKIVITLSLMTSDTGNVISTIPVECANEEEILDKIDATIQELKLALKMTVEQTEAELSKIMARGTTYSTKAFKLYSQGRALLLMGEYAQAVRMLEQAVNEDPQFASAYRLLASAYANVGDRTEWRLNYQRAFNLSDHASERERLLIQADYYRLSEQTWDKALDVFAKYTSQYPRDTAGINNMSIIYRGLEDYKKAIELGEFNRKNGAPGLPNHVNLANNYLAIGAYDRAREALEYYSQNFSDSTRLRTAFARLYSYQGKYDQAMAETDKALALTPTDYIAVLYKGRIELLKGDPLAASDDIQNLLNGSDAVRTQAGCLLSCVYIQEGKFEKAQQLLRHLNEEAEIEESKLSLMSAFLNIVLKSNNFSSAITESEKVFTAAAEMNDFGTQRYAHWMRGLAYVGMKDIESAQKTANELRELTEKTINRKAIRYYHHLQGCIEIEKENYPAAIDYLSRAVSSLSEPNMTKDAAVFYDSLAFAYFRSEDLVNAQRRYEAIGKLTYGRLEQGDIYVKSFLSLGMLAEKQGQREIAREMFHKFLELWKDADPGLPEVEDAKARLASL